MSEYDIENILNGLSIFAGVIAIGSIILVIALIYAVFNISANTTKMLELMKDLHYYKRIEYETEYKDYEDDETASD